MLVADDFSIGIFNAIQNRLDIAATQRFRNTIELSLTDFRRQRVAHVKAHVRGIG